MSTLCMNASDARLGKTSADPITIAPWDLPSICTFCAAPGVLVNSATGPLGGLPIWIAG